MDKKTKQNLIVILLLLCFSDVQAQYTFQTVFRNDLMLSHAYSVQLTTDGGYILCGHANGNNGPLEYCLLKADANGNMQWVKTYIGGEQQTGFSVIQTLDGGYLTCGTTFDGWGYSDATIIKTDGNGTVQWFKNIGGVFQDGVFKVLQDSVTGNFTFAGTSVVSGSNYEAYVFKLDPTGTMLWSATFGGPNADVVSDIEFTKDGGYILAGNSLSFGQGGTNFWDFYLVKIDGLGTSQWSRSFGGSGDERCEDVELTSDGGYILAGWTQSFGAGYVDGLMIKTDSMGILQWSRMYGDVWGEFFFPSDNFQTGGTYWEVP